MDDDKIIELFFERSEIAISELSKKYGPLCSKIANNILHNSLDVEECVNDTYLGVWNSIPPQKPNPLMAYVCKIARNLAIKKYHSNSAVKRNSNYDISLDELEYCLGSINSVEDDYNMKILAEKIDAFLDNIAPESRVIFMRRYWFSDSISDIADMLSVNNHNVSVRLHRIRENLRKYLMKEGYEL